MQYARDRLTMHNGKSGTYRASQISEVREENYCLFGEMVEKVGEYEELGRVEEVRELKEKRR